MVRGSFRALAACVGAGSLVLMLPVACAKPRAAIASTHAPDPVAALMTLQDLAGRWAGNGTITHASGANEAFQCVVTYTAKGAGAAMLQNFRCKGADSKFDAATTISFDGDSISGVWKDNVYFLDGTVTGTAGNGTLSLDLDSSFFKANMKVVNTGCEQQVRIVPSDKTTMREMAAILRRC